MKMVMVICPEGRREEIRSLIARHEVHAFSELGPVVGEGATGKHLGTDVWPGRSVLVFTVISDEKKRELLDALKACRDSLYPGEGLKAFTLPVEELL